jgi:hypothetical protein
VSGQPDRWIRRTTIVCVALLALIAGTVSYLHMHLLVELHGQPGWVAALTPLSVDGMIVAASTTLLADSRSGNRGGLLPWALLVVGSAASLAANVAVAEPTATGRVIAAWPSFSLIAGYGAPSRPSTRGPTNCSTRARCTCARPTSCRRWTNGSPGCLFRPDRLPATITDLTEAQADEPHAEAGKLREQLAEADRQLASYRAALDAGGDPAVVSAWITETQARKAGCQGPSRSPRRIAVGCRDQAGDFRNGQYHFRHRDPAEQG